MTEGSVGFCIFYDWLEVFALLDKEDVADLVFAIGRYYVEGADILDSVSDRAKPVALMISRQLERAKRRKDEQPPPTVKGRRLEEGLYETETKTNTQTKPLTETKTETKPKTEADTSLKIGNSKAGQNQSETCEGAYFGGGGDGTADILPFSFESDDRPTLSQIEDYVSECGIEFVNPKEFYDYNERRGWQIDGEPVRDWRSVISVWNCKRRPKNEQKRRYGDFGVNEAFERALKRSYGELS